LPPEAVFVEVGCGDAVVTQAVARHVREAVGIDVTAALIDHAAAPADFRFVQTDGTSLALADGGADMVYSNQLMEHLHPDDARQQLQEVVRVLRPGGRYVCSTPNRLTGPHDISGYFGHEPGGFHMREYDHGSLAAMFRDAGFRSIHAVVSVKGRRMMLPVGLVSLAERLLAGLPRGVQARLTSLGPVRNMFGVLLIGQK
ncbi:MAG TPA: class I SAM-dependent methyltransferase, partial [Acetobacteraceae bacterium]